MRLRLPPPSVIAPSLLLFGALLGAGPGPAEAAPPPRPGVTLRLVEAGARDGRPQIGLEIALEPGWKTYWRTPGDAGVPPDFDWSKSTGIAAVVPRFPVPVRFEEEGVRSIGYTGPVILPLDVTLADPKGVGTLDLDVHIGICRDICVPVSARLTAPIGADRTGTAADLGRLDAAREALPAPADPRGPRIVSLRRHPGTPETVTVGVADAPVAGGEESDLLVEGPDETWALPQPTRATALRPPPAAAAGDRTVTFWDFELDGVPKAADLGRAPLRFTLRAGSKAFEQTVGLDGTGVLP